MLGFCSWGFSLNSEPAKHSRVERASVFLFSNRLYLNKVKYITLILCAKSMPLWFQLFYILMRPNETARRTELWEKIQLNSLEIKVNIGS